jgi:uncharacterized membrane protein YfcA
MLGYDPALLAIITGAVFIGGIVKGIVGIGLPIVSIAILLNFLPPTVTLATVVIPIVATNFWQTFRSGLDLETFRRFRMMTLTFVSVMVVTAHFVVGLDTRLLFGLLGACVAAFALSNLLKPRAEPLNPATEKWAGPLAGALGGILGGISTIWGPPMMMYLVLLKLPKDVWIRGVGLIWFVGSIPLALSYWANGILNSETAPLSLYACLPGLAGIAVGERIRNHVNQETFSRVMLMVLFLIGLNLIRRALF